MVIHPNSRYLSFVITSDKFFSTSLTLWCLGFLKINLLSIVFNECEKITIVLSGSSFTSGTVKLFKKLDSSPKRRLSSNLFFSRNDLRKASVAAVV